MKLLKAVVALLLLLAMTAFGLFGFLATFEPTSNPGRFWAFRIGYAVVGLGCITTMILLIVKVVRKQG